ncbi:hypothetical protein N7G274_001313 [Stereocaulon virgatum]|uniref:C2H2-type domain-containing protein n=1 Tax=Stereocaulon virgatum TaxID=373712 RepID=A0ABR4ANG7_9LECA
MTPDALLAHLSKPKRSNWCLDNMLGSKSTSLQNPVHQNKGYIVEDAILVDDDSDTDSGEPQELEVPERWKDYVNLEDFGRQISVERRVRALKFEPLEYRSRLSSISRNRHGEYHSEKQSDAGGQTQKAPLTYMCSPEQGTHSEDTYPTYETTNGVDTKTAWNQEQPSPPKLPFSPGTAPNPLARTQEKSGQSKSESQVKVEAVAASPRKNYFNLARERAEKELTEQAAQCLLNEDNNGQSVDKALWTLALKKSSEEDTSTVSIATLDHRRKKEALSIASQCDLNPSPAAEVPDVGPLALAKPHKPTPTPPHGSNLHAKAPTESEPGSTALPTFSNILSSSKSTQDRAVSSVPFGTLILERAATAKVPTTPTEVTCTPSDGLNPQTVAQVEPQCGIAALSTSSKGPSSAKEQRVQDLFDLSPASSAAEQSEFIEKLRALQHGQIVCPMGSADPKQGFAALPASKAQIKPKELNGTKLSIKDLPPPLPVFDPRRKRPLSQIPMGELFRPDQVVSKQGYHDHKRQRQQEKKKAALHTDKYAEVQTVTDSTWATTGDVYETSVQGSNHQEPCGKLGVMDVTLAREGNKCISDNETLLIVDPDAQIGELGSKCELEVSHLGPASTRSPAKTLSSQVTKERSRKRSCNGMTKMQDYSKAARELEPTHVCGVFTPSRVPQGQDPTQLIPRFCLSRIDKCNTVCIICEGKFDKKRTLRNHFPKCVYVNGNPESHSWFDHQSVKRHAKRVTAWSKRITTEHQKPDPAELSVSENGAVSIHGSEVTSKPDKETSTKQPLATPQPTIQGDAEVYSDFDRTEQAMPVPPAHPNTGKKSISEAILAKWAAEEVEDADEEDDGMSEIELETPDIAYRYYVKRYEWPIHRLEEQHMGDTFGPFYTMNEANILAEQEIHRLDSDPGGNYPRNWRHICEQDEVGMRSYTVEMLGMHVKTVVYRDKSPNHRPYPL